MKVTKNNTRELQELLIQTCINYIKEHQLDEV